MPHAKPLSKGDIIGVTIDLSLPQISFSLNGETAYGFFSDFNTDGLFFPVVSMSAKSRLVVM